MTTIGDKIVAQLKDIDLLSRAFVNLKKKAGSCSRGNIESRLQALEQKWLLITNRHEVIESNKSADLVDHEYFVQDRFSAAEDTFHDQRGRFLDALHELTGSTSTSAISAIVEPTPPSRSRKLPGIELPKFSGRYQEWASFKDLFQALVTPGDVTDVERMHYLKQCLTGEAAAGIKNLPVTATNYARAWKLRALSKEVASDLKALRDETNDAVETLAGLGCPVKHWDHILVYMTVQKLDSRTRRDWETSISDTTEVPEFKTLIQFLSSRIHALDAVEMSKCPYQPSTIVSMRSTQAALNHQNSRSGKITSLTTTRSSTPQNCPVCKQDHLLIVCGKFRALPADQRKHLVIELRLCFNCLGTHQVRDCRSNKSCRHCQGNHHTLLHGSHPTGKSTTSGGINPPRADPKESPASHPLASESPGDRPVNTMTALTSGQPRPILLATARVIVCSTSDRRSEVRALIDPCSEATFISASLVQRLRLSRRSVMVPVTGIGATKSETVNSMASVSMLPHFESNLMWKIDALVLPRLTDYLPPKQPVAPRLDFIDGLRMADPNFFSDAPVDLILGVDIFTHLLDCGLRKSSDSELVAQETALGWIISGRLPGGAPSQIASLTSIVDSDLLQAVKRFWDQEEVLSYPIPALTVDEAKCEDHFLATTRRNSSGRYILRLPFNDKLSDLGSSYEAARHMQLRMEKRFDADQELRIKYLEFMKEYVQLGHARILDPSSDLDLQGFYLPHHGVLKTVNGNQKLRVVFNGSVRLPKRSLNECLLPGRKLQDDVRSVLLRWRLPRFCFSTDMEKMFRQFLISEEDQPYQKILWRESPSVPLQTYLLCTVTYGLTSSPFQALRTMLQLADDEKASYPRAAHILKNNRFVDDILAGADSPTEAMDLMAELTELLKAGGISLSKWTANDQCLLEGIPIDKLALSSELAWDDHGLVKTLGVSWSPISDCFTFRTIAPPNVETITKRHVLSYISNIYDPLGWLSPVTIALKIFMQSLWTTGLQWDERLPPSLHHQWASLTNDLPCLNAFRLPRWIFTSKTTEVELHGFSDASERAYAAVVFARTIDSSGAVSCTLLTAKTKVSPLKQVSIPRLELCGAVLLVRLVNQIQGELQLATSPCHLWSDSTVVLSWIQKHPTHWKTYVANRVSEIQTTLPQAVWHHVAGQDNPADAASRGIPVKVFLESRVWTSGPSFLRLSSESIFRYCHDVQEVTCLDAKGVSVHVQAPRPIKEWDILDRYSSLTKLLRVIARCQLFIRTLKDRIAGKHQEIPIELSPVHLRHALTFLMFHVQDLWFSDELTAVSSQAPLSKKSPLSRLNPMQDSQGLLRVGGRLQHSLLDPDEKHPIILPRDSSLSRLIIWDAHLRSLHGGTQLTLNLVRQRFWIVGGRSAVKAAIFKCLRCWRQKAVPTRQLMGPLPAARIRPNRPFLHTGLDYAGPIDMRLSYGHGARAYKGYIVVFVCMSTRAVHLEAASSYSSKEFLNIFHRFVGRRGICAALYSDCGTNFVGANRELRQLFDKASATSHEISSLLANDGTEWRFNPPAAPHFGGLWEAAVKSVKHHLKRVIGQATLTFEEMTTLLIRIEAALNSRPLQALRDDSTDFAALTPGHLLIGEPMTAIPAPSLPLDNYSMHDRFKLISQMFEHFWHRWSHEYLQELQHRSIWRTKQSSVKINDLCVLHTPNCPPCKWPLGRVIEVHPGCDGLVRVVTVRTATTVLTRPISKISILPGCDNSSRIDEGGRDVSE